MGGRRQVSSRSEMGLTQRARRIRLDRATTLFFVRPLMWARQRDRFAIPILMYHSITKDPEPAVLQYYRLTTSPSRFREQMCWLRRHGFSVISFTEALRRLAEGVPDARLTVVLTFDDGFHDFLTEACPILDEFDYPATVFLPTGYISQPRRLFKGRECLTWQEVRELDSLGIGFGSHTVTHPRLHGLDWVHVRAELADSRSKLEDQIGRPVQQFSYPYAFPQEDGVFVVRFRNELARHGYEAGVTTRIGRLEEGDDPFCIRRLPVNEDDDHSLFMAKLRGAYDWLASIQLAKRRALRWTRRHTGDRV